jgi:hypothetical protein
MRTRPKDGRAEQRRTDHGEVIYRLYRLPLRPLRVLSARFPPARTNLMANIKSPDESGKIRPHALLTSRSHALEMPRKKIRPRANEMPFRLAKRPCETLLLIIT